MSFQVDSRKLVLTPADLTLVQELADESKVQHQDDKRTHRKTREFGMGFFRMMEGDFTRGEIPPGLIELGRRVMQLFGADEATEIGNVILSIYGPGFHLEPHVDMDEAQAAALGKGFYFGERVFGLVIQPDLTGQLFFTKHEGEGLPPLDGARVYELKEEAGTAFCLQGESRHAPFHHGVSDVTTKRISLTFRSVVQTAS